MRIELSNCARSAWAIAAVVVTGFFGLPLWLMFYYGGDYLPIANESLAYRYFTCERIQTGAGETTWLPQGQLLGIVQHAILATIHHFMPDDPTWLRARVQAFAIATNSFSIALMGAILLVSALSTRLFWCDKLLVFLTAVAPIYLTRTAGFHYALLPDYYQLDMVLATLATATYMFQIRSENPPSVGCLLFLGALAGMMAANKITLAAVAGVMGVACCVRQPGSLRAFLQRAAIFATTAAASFALIFLVFYLFSFRAVFAMASQWYQFAMHSGGEPDFWVSRGREAMKNYQYGYIFAAWTAVAFLLFATAPVSRDRQIWRFVLVCFNTLAATALVYSLVKRPANTTLFELSVFLVALTAMFAVLIPFRALRTATIISIAVSSILFGGLTFEQQQNLLLVKESRQKADRLWRLHHDIVEAASEKKIVIIIPSNDYAHGGVHEFLLKGCSRFPTWQIDDWGQRILAQHAPNLEFRCPEANRCDVKVVPPALVVWFDRADLKPLSEQYPQLGKYLAASPRHWSWVIREGWTRVTACVVKK